MACLIARFIPSVSHDPWTTFNLDLENIKPFKYYGHIKTIPQLLGDPPIMGIYKNQLSQLSYSTDAKSFTVPLLS